MKILFISRAYPPVTGGIENQNYALSVWLDKVTPTDTLANRYGKKFLPLFFPYALFQALIRMHHYDVLLLGDGVLSVLGYIVKTCYPQKTVVNIVHGLDATYPNIIYQKFWIGMFLPSLDGIIVVSAETKIQLMKRAIPESKIRVVPNGIDGESLAGNFTRTDLEKLLGIDISDKHILLTSGRLAKRKGAEWFIRKVLGSLPKNTLYVLAGSGPEEHNIRKAIEDTHLANQVLLLGRVSDRNRNILLNTADIFVQPNIVVPGDMEGFGIAVIEAAVSGRPVVAADLEGLKDAIVNGENGILIPSEDAQTFTDTITHLLSDTDARLRLGERASAYTTEHYHWKTISTQYVETLKTFIH